MDKKEIEKEIAKRIVNADKSACNTQEIANAIMSENEQNNNFIDNNTAVEVPIIENDANKSSGNEGVVDNLENQEHKYGKFKNPQELLRAYGELEREFTRRSQKLKEYEMSKQNEGFLSEDEWKSAVDKFFEQTPSARVFAKDIARKLIENPTLKQDRNCLNIALNQVLIDSFKTPEQLMQDGQFLNDYVLNSKAVEEAIISKYLQQVRSGQPPHTLSQDGTNTIAPNRKPKSIEEAGFMFLKNNK